MERTPDYRGTWWPATDSSLALGGTLSHAGRYGYELEINGRPEEISQLGEATIEGIPIYGHVSDGTAITVQYLPMSEMPGASSTKLHVEQAMVGIHSEAPLFESALFGFRYLTAWSGRASALRPVIETSGGMTGVAYDKQPNLTASVGDATLTIGDSATGSSSLDGDTVSRTTEFMLQTGAPETFGELLGKYLRPIQHMMSFANDQGLAIKELRLKAVGEQGSVVPLFEPIFEPTEPDGGVWQPLFRLADAPGGLSELVTRWFDFYQRVHPLLDLLFLPRYVERIPFTEQTLLIYAQAAEGLHQRLHDRFDQTSLALEDHELLMAELKSGVSDQRLMKWAQDRLHRNDRSFKQRLMDLIEYGGPAISEILKPTPSKWANQMRDARDRWTHWSPGASSQLDGGEAWRLSAALAAVLESCILAELGFGDDLRAEIIRRSENYRWAALVG